MWVNEQSIGSDISKERYVKLTNNEEPKQKFANYTVDVQNEKDAVACILKNIITALFKDYIVQNVHDFTATNFYIGFNEEHEYSNLAREIL